MADWDIEPTLAATQDAAEAVRAACHAAYHAPKADTGNVYDRCGALYQLLICVEQAVSDLSRHADRLTSSPGLTTTGAADPNVVVSRAAHLLLQAQGSVVEAHTLVNDAWTELSSLYIADVAE